MKTVSQSKMKTWTAFAATTLLMAPAVLFAADQAATATGHMQVNTAASAVAAVPKPVSTTKATATTAIGRQGDNQYPAGTLVTPPKPKKDGLEATTTIKSNQGDNQYPAGTLVTPPKPKKETLEGAATKVNAQP